MIQYYLRDPAEVVTVEILDGEGSVIRSFEGTRENQEEAKEEGGPRPPWEAPDAPPPPGVARGLNRFVWDLRYPGATTFDGMIIWSARPERGPLAPPGDYQVRVTIGEVSATAPFRVRMDPRLDGVTEADLAEQFALAVRIRDRTSAANEAVIAIRDVKQQIEGRLEAGEEAVSAAGRALLASLSDVEQALYQVKNRSGQDPLNFPIRLNNRLASLRRSVETGEARPTDGAYRVFEELSAELADHLSRLRMLLDEELADLNRLLEASGLEPVRPGY